MNTLLDSLQERQLIISGPGLSNVNMIDAIHPFDPCHPILLELVAIEAGISLQAPSKDLICRFTLGYGFCHRYEATVWEVFGSDDVGKQQHFAGFLLLLKRFVLKTATDTSSLSRYL